MYGVTAVHTVWAVLDEGGGRPASPHEPLNPRKSGERDKVQQRDRMQQRESVCVFVCQRERESVCVRECQNERVKERKSVGRADGNKEM